MTLLLDSGALIAVDRNDRAMWVRLKAAQQAGNTPVTHGGVVGQVWRGGARQARLASALRGVDVQVLDEHLGRRVGVLIGATGVTDVIDAALVALAVDGDDIVTSDPDDLAQLAAARGLHIEVLHP